MRMHRTGPTAATAVLALLMGLMAVGTPARAATAEVYPIPASGVLTLDGHGFGHGHGMSQWGSQGAATLKVSADTITSTYYPGTFRAQIAPASIRVWLSADNDSETQVYAASGLRAADGEADLGLLPAGYLRWRVRLAADAFHQQISGWNGSAWVAVGGPRTGPVGFSGPSTVRVALPDGSSRGYRGTVRAVRWSGTSPATLRTVDVLDLEYYLFGVVPSESPPWWLPAALQAQAIAARSYSAYLRAHPRSSVYDICDSTACQVFGGSTFYPAGYPADPATSLEPASTTAAVIATRGVVRSSSASTTVPIFAEFSSSNGGWSADGGLPYLPARRDDWDGVVASTAHTWVGSLPAAALTAKGAWPQLGRPVTLTVLSRDGHGEWGGRVLNIELRGVAADGSATLVTTTGDAVRRAAGLRSTWWRPRQPPPDELSPGAFAAAPGTDELVRRLPDGTVAERTWSAVSGLSAERTAGGAIVGTPAVVSRPSGGLDAFGRSAAGHLMTTHRSSAGSWGAWQDLGGDLAGRPSVIRGRSDELQVFAVFRDGQVHHLWSVSPGTWSAWESLGGAALPGSGPSAVTLSAGSYDLVVLGTDHAVWRRSYRGGWGSWASLGGSLSGDPSMSSAAGELTVVGRAPNLAVYALTVTGSSSSGWRSLGGLLISNPAGAAVPASGRLDVFAVAGNGALYRTTRTGSGWSGWRAA